MKRLYVILSVMSLAICANAQHLPKSFFDAKGNIRMETKELDETADTLVTIFHRTEDIVWSKVVYRVIDMRYKQNFQLYYPVHTDHERYHNLLNLMANAVINGMPIYSTESNLIKGKINPDYSNEARLPYRDIPIAFQIAGADYPPPSTEEEEAFAAFYDRTKSPSMTILCKDSVDENAGYEANFKDFELLVRNQLKYLIQEIVFFDKHTSRLYSKIIGIAPLYSAKIEIQEPETYEDYRDAFLQSIMFWVLYDDLRPYLAKQYMIPFNNESKRVTYEEFFQKKLYSSYVVAESNMYDRMILDYSINHDDIVREQERIQSEMLTFEQDLWEY